MKTFFSIGAGPGIGYATAERFAKEGFHIILAGRNEKKLEDLKEQLEKNGHSAQSIILDASDLDAVRNSILQISDKHNGIDVLHYNAAAMRAATIEEQPLDTILPDLATNIGGALAAIKTVEPIMSKQSSGTILLTGGVFATKPNPQYMSLSLGKAAIHNIAQGLFEPFKEKNIHIAALNIAAQVTPNSKASKEVADAFWNLHDADINDWVPEVTYTEGPEN